MTMAPEAATSIELSALIGLREITGIDRGNVGPSWMAAWVRIDGLVYQFEQDADDDYRSSLRDVTVVDHAVTQFARPMLVEFLSRETDRNGAPVLLYAVNEQTGLVVLEVGTENWDDYYPSFVFSWTPEGYTPYWLEASEDQ